MKIVFLDDYRRFSFEGYIIISHAIGQGTIEKTQKNRASQLLKAKIEKKGIFLSSILNIIKIIKNTLKNYLNLITK